MASSRQGGGGANLNEDGWSQRNLSVPSCTCTVPNRVSMPTWKQKYSHLILHRRRARKPVEVNFSSEEEGNGVWIRRLSGREFPCDRRSLLRYAQSVKAAKVKEHTISSCIKLNIIVIDNGNSPIRRGYPITFQRTNSERRQAPPKCTKRTRDSTLGDILIN